MDHLKKRKHPDRRDEYQACFASQLGLRHAITAGTRKREALNHTGHIMAEIRESAYGIGDIVFEECNVAFLRAKERGAELKRAGLAQPRERKGG